jgi:hypothetical protein
MTTVNRFALIASEAGIASDQLAHGVALMSRIDLGDPATFAEVFFPLTVGLERSAKLAYSLDFYATTREFPADTEFRGFGHKLNDLLVKLEEIVSRRWPDVKAVDRPRLQVHDSIVKCLAIFASAHGRYYNLAALGGRTSIVDPVKLWIETVIIPTYRENYADGSEARLSQPGTDIERTLAEFNVRNGSEPFVRLAVLQIARWVSLIIIRLYEEVHAYLPHMPEFFARFDRDDKYFMKHKTYPGRT